MLQDLHPEDPDAAIIILCGGIYERGGNVGYLGFPPDPQELRARKIGHVVVNTALNRPWSQYFCCLITGEREWVRKHPVATKRAMRAILKAADLCALEPVRAARVLRCPSGFQICSVHG